MNDERTLELIARSGPDGTQLVAPSVGWFTCAVDKGCVLTAGGEAGVLRTLGVARALRVPAGVTGRVTNARPERVNAPVGYGDVLYELAPMTGEGAADEALVESVADDTDGLLAVRAPYSGRFWHRPAPGEDAFVTAGDTLEAGLTVGLLEVMKTFSHLHYAPADGLPERAQVVRVLVGDGDEVAQGDALIEVTSAG
jgi:acetyl-CoA carboxylase biotin carboxyl carrier protein